MITIQEMVSREVEQCLSVLVSTLAGGWAAVDSGFDKKIRGHGETPAADLAGLCEQAFELAGPVEDFEEAAIQAGWYYHDEYKTWVNRSADRDPREDREEYGSAEDLCRTCEIEPYQSEVFEHWAVSSWFAEKLAALGEKVDTDFAGMNVWARCTTGQAIYSDGVIERIYADMGKA